MVYIVMGVSGSGKTAIGRQLAARLGTAFHDADDFHPVANIEKMRRGEPLDDGDRAPWLIDLALHVAQWNRSGGAVLACSALKQKYRDVLSWNGNEETSYIYLKASRDIILRRMKGRDGHFFPPGLLDTQLDDLEEPAGAITVAADAGPEEVCGAVLAELDLRGLLPSAGARP